MSLRGKFLCKGSPCSLELNGPRPQAWLCPYQAQAELCPQSSLVG